MSEAGLTHRFVEFVLEEDGTWTAICEQQDGTRYQLKDCKITGYKDESRSENLKITECRFVGKIA